MKIIRTIIALAALLTIATSCTEQHIARRYVGKLKIELPKGEKLIMATWKKANLFYLTEPMDSGYLPEKKVFRERSNFGIWQSEITFIERR